MKNGDLKRAVQIAERGEVSFEALVTERHTLASAAAAFESLVSRSGIKIGIEPNG